MKFHGIKEREHESNEDTEDLLRNFLRTDLKISKEDEGSIQFERVHRVSARRVSSGTPNSKPRPIIVKLSTTKSLLNLLQKPYERPQSWNFRRLSKGGRRNEEKAVPSTKSRQARKAYCIFQGRKANYRWVALPRPRDNCFPLYGHLMDV